jgi:hypothetical protein
MLVQRILTCREKGLSPSRIRRNAKSFPSAHYSGPGTSLEKAVQLIKGGFSHQFHQQGKNRMEIWQVGFHDWTI